MLSLVLDGTRDETLEILVPKGAVEEVRIAARTKNSEHMRVKVKVRHEGDDSHSRVELFGAARDSSKIDFIIELDTPPRLENITAHQNAHVLLLSDNATATTTPRQNVATPGAKTFHGASITGIPLDKDFFLSCLGLDADDKGRVLEASHLTRAFAGLPDNMLEPLLKLIYDGAKEE